MRPKSVTRKLEPQTPDLWPQEPTFCSSIGAIGPPKDCANTTARARICFCQKGFHSPILYPSQNPELRFEVEQLVFAFFYSFEAYLLQN